MTSSWPSRETSRMAAPSNSTLTEIRGRMRRGGLWQSSYPFQSEAVTELNLRVGQGATPTVTQQSGPTSTASPTSTSTVTPAAGNTRRKFTGAHCDQANAAGHRGRDDTPTDSRQRYTSSAAVNASCTANRPTKGADHATHAACVAVLSTDVCADTGCTQRNISGRAPITDGNPGGAAHNATCHGHTRSHRKSLGRHSPPYQCADPVRRGSASTQSSPAPSGPEPDAGSFGGLLAPLAGGAVLAIAAVVVGVIVLRQAIG